MKTILIPTDFSQPAQRAIHYAVRLFERTDARFILVHAYQIPNAGQHVLISLDDLLREEAERDMAEQKQRILAETNLTEDRLSTILYHGAVVTAIDRVIENETVDMVVMGTVGASGVLEKWMGSNAAAVIRDIDVPVVAVPHNAPVRIPHRIALASDASEPDRAMDTLRTLAEAWGASVNIFHVDTGEAQLEATIAAEARETIGERLGDVAYSYATVSNTSVEDGIDQFVRGNSADMLAMIPQRRGFLGRLFNKSVSRSMSMKTEVPLLILRD